MNRHLLAILTCICLSVQLNAAEWGSGASSAWENKIDLSVKDYMGEVRQGNYLHFDNYLQYAPLAASVLLGICPDYRDGWQDRILLAGTGSAVMAAMVNSLKYSTCRMRPDGSSRNSFPSGHTATAFVGAEIVRMEYGNGWGAAAYVIATATGVMRMYNERHWFTDVLAGAGIGFVSAKIAYWLLPWEKRWLGKVSFLPCFAETPDGNIAQCLTLAITF